MARNGFNRFLVLRSLCVSAGSNLLLPVGLAGVLAGNIPAKKRDGRLSPPAPNPYNQTNC